MRLLLPIALRLGQGALYWARVLMALLELLALTLAHVFLSPFLFLLILILLLIKNGERLRD